MKRARLTNKEQEALIEYLTKTVNQNPNAQDITINIDKILKPIKKAEVKPILRITAEVMVKMFSLVAFYKDEISWHCFSKREKVGNEKIYTIYDLTVFPQINSATSTDADEKEYPKWLSELLSDPDSDFENMRVHGHSHVNMQVFSSGIDDGYQQELLTKLKDDDYYIFLILNKHMEMCVLIYDFEEKILFESDDIYLEIISDGKNILEDVIKEIAEKTKTRTVTRHTITPSHSDLALDQTSFFERPVFKDRRKKHGFK